MLCHHLRSSARRLCLGHFLAIYPTVCLAACLALCLIAVGLSTAHAADSTNMKTITPDELARVLASKEAHKESQPLVLDVGPRMLFVQAHIPGAEYVGAGNTPEGLQRMNRRVEKLPKNSAIVLYCGCCPWSHCPNVNPAHDALLKLGFTNVKVLYIANNFGADWVDKGYPVAKGEQ